MNTRLLTTLALAAIAASAILPARAETWWEGDTYTDEGKTYWEDSGNWWGGFSTPAHFVKRNFTDGKSRTVCFRQANEFTGYLVFGNDSASDAAGTAGAVVFRADSATDGFKITNNETIYIGAGDGAGSVRVESGTYSAAYWQVGQSKTASLEVAGGIVTSRNSPSIGKDSGSAGALTVSDGGVFVSGEGTAETQLKLSENDGSTGTININEGGELRTAHIQPGTGTPVVNFNGGTLTVNYNGTVFASRDNFTVNVNTAGGTLDTAGHETYIKALVQGEGTLTITGGGTVRLDNNGVKPTCPLYVADGVVFLTTATTPASIRIGEQGFLRYDLVNVTDSVAEDQTLAENVTITMDDGETLAEHVLIRNDGSLKWQAYLDGTTLKAKNMTGETVTTTIWTDYASDHWCDRAQNWSCGIPANGVKTIIPFATRITQGTANLDCGDMVLKTYGQLQIDSDSNDSSLYHFAAGTISGDGTLYMSLNYFETTSDYDSFIEVPLTLYDNSRNTYIQSKNSHTIHINAPLTIANESKSCTVQNLVEINSDLTVTGSVKFNNTQTLKGAISGTGTITGSFATAAGAKVVATVTGGSGVSPLATEYLTVTGDADLANATVEIAGGDLLADADVGT